jgi:RNA polymerase sigma-70 factor (ECF subfamily)
VDGAGGSGPMAELPSIEELYSRHGPMVFRRARAILGDEQSAQDAMQEVFVKAIRERETFRGESSPVTWLYKITTNLCLNRIRDASRRRALLDERGPVSGESHEASAETLATLAAVLAKVPEDLREIGVYYFLDEMNQDEIAALIGVSRRTVGYRLDAFREAVKRAGDETPGKGGA